MGVDVKSFLREAAERCGVQRETYIEKNIPTLTSNISVVSCYGDIRSIFILATFLLKRLKEADHSKYVILSSWPGYKAIFPYVDEYWTMKDNGTLSLLTQNVYEFSNISDQVTNYNRNLMEHFSHVTTARDLVKYYRNGFTAEYWGAFKEVKLTLPEIPSVSRSKVRVTDEKVVVFPVQRIRSWQKGKLEYIKVPKEFWIKLAERLKSEKIRPMIYQNNFTYDLSDYFADNCSYLVSKDILDVLSVMREVGCVLDVYSGISRLAIAARCPFIAVDERNRFMNQKEYEIDDLSCTGLSKQYLFSFAELLPTGSPGDWNNLVIDAVVVKLSDFLVQKKKMVLPSCEEVDRTVSYDAVRQRTMKRMGLRFIRKR